MNKFGFSSTYILICMFFVIILFSVNLYSDLPDDVWAKIGLSKGKERIVPKDMGVDDKGNSYYLCTFSDTLKIADKKISSYNDHDAFLLKLDASGNVIWYQTFSDYPYKLAVNAIGNVYLKFYREIKKLDGDGETVWERYFPGVSFYGITLDRDGNLYVTGNTYQGDERVFDDFTISKKDKNRDFIARIDPTGTFTMFKNFGGKKLLATKITVDNSGNIIVAGHFEKKAFFDDIKLKGKGDRSLFIAKADSNGNWLWAEPFGGRTEWQDLRSIALDNEGNVFAIGNFSGEAAFNKNKFRSKKSNTFICKLSAAGNWLWVKSIDTSRTNRAYEISVNNNGEPMVIGSSRSNFQLDGQKFILPEDTYRSVYIARFGNNGECTSLKNLGKVNVNDGKNLIVEKDDNVHLITGFYKFTDHGIKIDKSYYKGVLIAKMKNDLDLKNIVMPARDKPKPLLYSKADDHIELAWAVSAGGPSIEDVENIQIIDNIVTVQGGYTIEADFGKITITGMAMGNYLAVVEQDGNWGYAKNLAKSDRYIKMIAGKNGNVYGITHLEQGEYLELDGSRWRSKGQRDILVTTNEKGADISTGLRIGGEGYDTFMKFSSDNFNNTFIAGEFTRELSHGITNYYPEEGKNNYFLEKLDGIGSRWMLQASSKKQIKINGISGTDSDITYVTGEFAGDLSFSNYSTESADFYGYDLFVAKVKKDGDLGWLKKAGGVENDSGSACVADEYGDCYILGKINGSAKFGKCGIEESGMFLAKLSSGGSWQWVIGLDSSNIAVPQVMTIDDDGNLYIAGNFTGSVEIGSTELISRGDSDIFVAKIILK